MTKVGPSDPSVGLLSRDRIMNAFSALGGRLWALDQNVTLSSTPERLKTLSTGTQILGMRAS
jgi:hypothetical protein